MRRAAVAVLCLALPLGLAGCGEDVPPPEIYAPVQFDYLSKLKLNVGTIVVENHAQPMGPDDVTAQSPLQPAQALEEMAHQRLFAAGFAGTATFTIDQASIVQGPGGTLTGTLAVHLTVSVPGNPQAGFATATVQRQHVPGSDPENATNNLYDLTKQMIDAMNVEFEFQLKRSLGSWLVTGAAIPAPVEAQPLSATPLPGPGAPAPMAATPPPPPVAAAPPSPPPAANDRYVDPLSPGLTAAPPAAPAPPPQQMSPPPGTLQAPPGVAPDSGY